MKVAITFDNKDEMSSLKKAVHSDELHGALTDVVRDCEHWLDNHTVPADVLITEIKRIAEAALKKTE